MTIRSASSGLLALLLLGACDKPASPPAQPAATQPTPDPGRAGPNFEKLAERLVDEGLAANPTHGVELGLHEYDGKLPDVSAAGLEKEAARLQAAIQSLEDLDPKTIEPAQQVERTALITAMWGQLFELKERASHRRNPMFYLAALDLTPYISRDYAPLEQRARAILQIANATPAHLDAAMENLDKAMPRTFVNTALLQARGTSTFIREDVKAATAGLTDTALAKELDASLERMAREVDRYAAFLEQAQANANDDFALGPERFQAMLARTQGIDISLADLEKTLRADLERNKAAMVEAAKAVDPKLSTAKAVAKVRKSKPKPSEVLATATEQATKMRAFVMSSDIVTIPTEDVAEVVPTPPFMRWNAAFLSSAGVFEPTPLPSFYYISPPDPSWPKAKQRDYVPGTADLLFITIHEVWPGHFLHSLHLKVVNSRVLKSTWNYTTSEGWAHYTEEMMWDAGVSEDPAVHVGQLQNALLRNVRAISALGLHTQGITVEESKSMFVELAFQDEANAEQQAVRGTFDPMYLAYTTGKLGILKLKDDVRVARGEQFTDKAFHDEFLSHGAAPLAAIRASMLGANAGPVL